MFRMISSNVILLKSPEKKMDMAQMSRLKIDCFLLQVISFSESRKTCKKATRKADTHRSVYFSRRPAILATLSTTVSKSCYIICLPSLKGAFRCELKYVKIRALLSYSNRGQNETKIGFMFFKQLLFLYHCDIQYTIARNLVDKTRNIFFIPAIFFNLENSSN